MTQNFTLCHCDAPHEGSHLPTLLVFTWSPGARIASERQTATVPEVVERYLDEEPTWEDAAWV